MRPLATREEARAFDAAAIAAGVPGLVLMENAARGATDVLVARFADRLGGVVIVGGLGQNGGDAWAIGRQLLSRGVTPAAVVVLGGSDAVLGDARVNLDALRALGATVHDVVTDADLGRLEAALAPATVIVDGLFGTGLSRPIVGLPAAAIAAMSASAAPIVALDLPSGVDADTGAVLGTSVRATLTVTFGAEKRGLHQEPGRERAGEIVLASIGVPPPRAADAWLLEAADLRTLIARRPAAAHKGTAGHVLVLAGSPGHTGAALLCGLGAMRAGAGLVTLAARGAARAALDQKVVELMTAEIPEALEAGALAIQRESERKDALVVGPGLGLDAPARELALRVAIESALPAVLDADALTALASRPEALRPARGARVLTPHPGEAARLLGCSVAEVQADRHRAASELRARTGATVVLKGRGTVIAGSDGHRVCPRGTPALGVGGTGDVLAGAIGALLAGGATADDAAAGAVLLHALAGERAAAADRGLLAHEVADAMPAALAEAHGQSG